MTTSFSGDTLDTLREPLDRALGQLMRRYPGESGRRQPVHTVYGGGHLFRSDTAARLGKAALGALLEYAPNAQTLGAVIGVKDSENARVIHRHVVDKLEREPVEDFRIDFEDGYGNRPDAEEDGHAASAAQEVARGMANGTLPFAIGIRVKPLSAELRERSIRTLDIFLSGLLSESGGRLPANFVITLPKVTIPEQTAFFARVLDHAEQTLGLEPLALRFEMMVETPQTILDASGKSALPAMLDASLGRMTAAHFGTYDYTAGVNIVASEQRMRHPACAFALQAMQVAFAGTGVWLSDGSTAILPVPVNRPGQGERLSAEQERANAASVHRAWRLHYDDVRNSLANGFYQGWDLHPAQLVTRYAAIYSFFLEGLDASAERLRNFVSKAAQATLVGDVFDDAATGQGLLNFFLRGINSGAVTEDEVVKRTGVTREELSARSFVTILRNRRRMS